MPTLHIFRSGNHTDSSGASLAFSAADIAGIATSYDPSKSEAPLVVGHPTTDAPAYGWVAGLRADATGLHATPSQVEPAFGEMVSSGRFKKISIALYTPGAKNNPAPNGYYLKHVGFLGAAAPAIKGLRNAAFSSDDDSINFNFDVPTGAQPKPETILMTPEEAAALRVELAAAKAKIDELALSAKTSAQFAEREDALAKLEASAKQKTDALAAQAKIFEASAKSVESAKRTEFVEGLATKGQVLPADKAGLVAALGALGVEEVEFADGTETKKAVPREWMQNWLSTRLPATVDYGEHTPDADASQRPATDKRVARLAGLPPGMELDAESAKQMKKAISYCEQHKIEVTQEKVLAAIVSIEEGA